MKPTMAPEPKVYEWTQTVRRTNLGTIDEFNSQIMQVRLDENNYDRYKKYMLINPGKPYAWYARDIGETISLYVLPNGKMVGLHHSGVGKNDEGSFVSAWSNPRIFVVNDGCVWWNQIIRTCKPYWVDEK